jgi:hypothetical protein
MLRRLRTPLGAVLMALAIVGAFGAYLWIDARDGAKHVDLGASLLGGAVVGFSLLLAERMWANSADERQRIDAMGPSATPDAGKRDDAAPIATTRRPDGGAP